VYDAILRYESARFRHSATGSSTLEDRIIHFWEKPESIGSYAGGEQELWTLARDILAAVPDDLKSGALARLER
jgi:hypothetical protein